MSCGTSIFTLLSHTCTAVNIGKYAIQTALKLEKECIKVANSGHESDRFFIGKLSDTINPNWGISTNSPISVKISVKSAETFDIYQNGKFTPHIVGDATFSDIIVSNPQSEDYFIQRPLETDFKTVKFMRGFSRFLIDDIVPTGDLSKLMDDFNKYYKFLPELEAKDLSFPTTSSLDAEIRTIIDDLSQKNFNATKNVTTENVYFPYTKKSSPSITCFLRVGAYSLDDLRKLTVRQIECLGAVNEFFVEFLETIPTMKFIRIGDYIVKNVISPNSIDASTFETQYPDVYKIVTRPRGTLDYPNNKGIKITFSDDNTTLTVTNNNLLETDAIDFAIIRIIGDVTIGSVHNIASTNPILLKGDKIPENVKISVEKTDGLWIIGQFMSQEAQAANTTDPTKYKTFSIDKPPSSSAPSQHSPSPPPPAPGKGMSTTKKIVYATIIIGAILFFLAGGIIAAILFFYILNKHNSQ